jgi:hypothetical protein
MHRFQLIRCLTLSACIAFAAAAFAQTGAGQNPPQSAHPPANIGMPHQLALTGCLKRGNAAGTFALTDQTGKTWTLISGSSDVDLSKHIFHVVTVGAKDIPPSQQHEAAGQAAEDSQSPPRLALRVLTLEVVSRSCTR